jgi:hypothetical protein
VRPSRYSPGDPLQRVGKLPYPASIRRNPAERGVGFGVVDFEFLSNRVQRIPEPLLPFVVINGPDLTVYRTKHVRGKFEHLHREQRWIQGNAGWLPLVPPDAPAPFWIGINRFVTLKEIYHSLNRHDI